MKRVIIIMMVLVSVSFSLRAEEPETVIDRVSFHGYDNQGAFVTVPTTCANYLGVGVSIIPAGVFYSLSYLGGVSDANCDNVAFYTTKGITMLFGAAIGAPFLAVKAVAWDAPKYLFAGLSPYSNDEVKINPANHPVTPKNSKQAE